MIQPLSIAVATDTATPGAARDARTLKSKVRTFNYSADHTDGVVIQSSGNGTNWQDLRTVSNSTVFTIEDASAHYRTRRKAGSGGTATLFVSAEPQATAGESFFWGKGPDVDATEQLGPLAILRVNGSRRIRDLAFSPWANVTGDATNHATVEVKVYTAAGALRGVIGSLTTANHTANVLAALTLHSNFLDLNDGEQVMAEVIKNGTGVQLGGFSILGRFEQ